jgi:hypothetical protein
VIIATHPALCAGAQQLIAVLLAMAPPTGNFVGEIRYETTPGKPMQLAQPGLPAERIVARREGAKYTLQVMRNVGTKLEEATAAISEAEWHTLEDAINKGGLLEWQAKETGVRADDYSTTAFSIFTREVKLANAQMWHQPVVNPHLPATLATALGALARAKIKKPQLFYFGP